ncbi:MAG: DUF4389 domain-containing protein [Dehalococcoidales bacterium]
MAQTSTSYPVSLSIDYPERPLNRLTSFFRIFTVIPIFIILALLAGSNGNQETMVGQWRWEYSAATVFIPLMLMLLFRQKYPRWWFDWNIALIKFGNRVCAYLALIRDEYPSTDEDQEDHIEIHYPDAERDLHRGMPLVKWLLAIPHYIILLFLYIGVMFCVLIAWFAILFTGRYPPGLFDFVVGVLRWSLRVEAYAVLLTTDRYPPFRRSD